MNEVCGQPSGTNFIVADLHMLKCEVYVVKVQYEPFIPLNYQRQKHLNHR